VFTGYGRLDPVYEPIVRLAVVLAVMWLVCVWLYRQRIFVKI
jgi:predicted acyltransferase